MSDEKKQSFLHGAALLAGATAIVKIIGAFYKIPLNAIIGAQGFSYFYTAYEIYSVLLLVSTAGLPVAVSRLSSQAHSMRPYNQVRQVYKISNVGAVAGCYVLEGKIARNANIRVVRDGIIIADDKLDSLKRFKDDVKEVASGYECGMTLTKFNDIKEGDIFEAYIVEEYRDN